MNTRMRVAGREEFYREFELEQKNCVEDRASREKVKLKNFRLFMEMFRSNKK